MAFDQESEARIAQVVQKFERIMSRRLPVRRRVIGAGGAGAAVTGLFGVVTTEIAAASGSVSSITAGSGEIEVYQSDGATPPVWTPDGNGSVQIFNTYFDSFPERTAVWFVEIGEEPDVVKFVESAGCTLVPP